MHNVVASKYLRIHYKHFCKHVYLLYMHSGFVDHIVDWTVLNVEFENIINCYFCWNYSPSLAAIIFTVEYTVRHYWERKKYSTQSLESFWGNFLFYLFANNKFIDCKIESLGFDWHNGKIVFFLRNVYDGKVRPLFCSANFLSKYFSLSLGSYNHDSELQCHKPVFGHELKIKWFPVFLSLRWKRKTIE